MKHLISILFIGSALTFAACGKDKKPAMTEPAKTEPAAAEPKAGETKPDETAAPAPGDEAKPEGEKKAGGGW